MPSVGCIATLVAILVVIVVEVLDAVLVVRETCRCAPLEVRKLDVLRVQSDFETLVSNLTQVGCYAAETSEVRQTLSHNHILCGLAVPLDATRQTLTKNSKVETYVDGRCLLPFKVRIGKAAY